MSLSVAERIAQVAEHFAADDAHGYSQPNRGTGGTETITLSDGSVWSITASDVDCSEMVRQCVNVGLGGKKISYMWTGDEDEKLRAQGFTRMAFSAAAVQRGDVLWKSGHTGVALGGGKQADAAVDEVGGITGPKRGDQTGSEVAVRTLKSYWTRIYRYTGGGTSTTTDSATPTAEATPSTTYFPASFKLTVDNFCNVRVLPSLSARITGTLTGGDSVTCDRMTQAEGRLWAGYVANSGNVRWVSLGAINSWITVS